MKQQCALSDDILGTPTRQERANSRDCEYTVIAKLQMLKIRSCAFDHHHFLSSPLSSLWLPSKRRATALATPLLLASHPRHNFTLTVTAKAYLRTSCHEPIHVRPSGAYLYFCMQGAHAIWSIKYSGYISLPEKQRLFPPSRRLPSITTRFKCPMAQWEGLTHFR